jgi:hypothetical protein
MSNFTKGPWDIVKTRGGSIVTVMSEKSAHIAEMVRWHTTDAELLAESEANARLIASAPCLLSALQAITNSGPDAIPIKEAFEMAHRAIERATGGNV